MPKLSHFLTKMGVNVGFSVQYSIQFIQSRGFKGIGFKPKIFKRIGFKPKRFKCMDFNTIGYKRIRFKPIWFFNVIFNSKVILTKSTNESSCAQRELTSFTPWNHQGLQGSRLTFPPPSPYNQIVLYLYYRELVLN